MKVRNDKVSVVVLEVGRRYRKHQASEATKGEQHEKADAEEHGRLKTECTPPHSGDPVEDLNAGRDGNEHGRIHKEQLSGHRHPYRIHVMRPDNEG